MTATERIEAPWTAAQVDALNRFQHYGFVHEFTCPGPHEHGGDRTLVATRFGWICPHCNYTQNWAHKAMTEVWKNPVPDPRDTFVEMVARAGDEAANINPRRTLETLVASARMLKARQHGLRVVT